MTPLQIAATVLVTLLGVGLVAYAVLVVRTLRSTRKPIPIDTGGPARKVAENLPLTEGAPTPAMDIYGPPDRAGGPRPLVLFVPGDGPEMILKNAKEWALFLSYGEICSARGYLAAVTNHRSSGNYKRTEGMVLDVVHALERLRRGADEFGIDPDRIVVWTFSGSAGPVLAHLAQHPVEGVRGLISFYGMLDLSTYLLRVPDPVVREYSLPQVLSRLEGLPCPVYLLAVGRDSKMITRGYENTRKAIAGRELPVTTREYAGGRHGFEVSSPPVEIAQQIDLAFAFVDTCLEPASPGLK